MLNIVKVESMTNSRGVVQTNVLVEGRVITLSGRNAGNSDTKQKNLIFRGQFQGNASDFVGTTIRGAHLITRPLTDEEKANLPEDERTFTAPDGQVFDVKNGTFLDISNPVQYMQDTDALSAACVRVENVLEDAS